LYHSVLRRTKAEVSCRKNEFGGYVVRKAVEKPTRKNARITGVTTDPDDGIYVTIA
jgi:hypothetical protein